jgi:hypothetical protein
VPADDRIRIGGGRHMMAVRRRGWPKSLFERLDLGYTAALVAGVVLFLALVGAYFGAV